MKCVACLESNATLRCSSCDACACKDCQQQYEIPSCMNCQVKFTKRFLQLHPPLVQTLLRPHEENTLWNREKALLPNTQVLVDWETKVEDLRKRLRFGHIVTFPPKPTFLLSSVDQIFACPGTDCRGFTDGKQCGSCKKVICMQCREFQTPDHVCNKEVLETLALLKMDSKPCPRCVTPIFKTIGCDHMFCTRCRTHFDWVTLKILAKSTNHHYDNTQEFASNVATVAGRVDSCVRRDIALTAVPRSSLSSPLVRWLFHETSSTKLLLSAVFHQEKLSRKHQESLIRLRIDFLQGKYTEEQVKSKLWNLEQQHEKKLCYNNLLSLYIDVVQDLQHVWSSHHFPIEDEEVSNLFVMLLRTCQESSQSIADEHGGVAIQFRVTSNEGPFVTLSH